MKRKVCLQSILIVGILTSALHSGVNITSPMTNQDFYPYVGVNLLGKGAVEDSRVAVTVQNHRQIAVKTAVIDTNGDGDFGESIEPPSGGWEIDPAGKNHSITVLDLMGSSDLRKFKVVKKTGPPDVDEM